MVFFASVYAITSKIGYEIAVIIAEITDLTSPRLLRLPEPVDNTDL
jgi:hypothetical protein